MAYTPSAAVQTLLEKSRNAYKTGWKPTAAEAAMLTQHSQAMIADMAPQQVSGGGGQYDYGSGQTGGYGGYTGDQSSSGGGTGSRSVTGADGKMYFLPDTTATSFEKYQNFIREETGRRQEGLAPRPLPSTFTQFLSQQNPLGYSGQGDTQQIKSSPLVNSSGVSVDPVQALGMQKAAQMGLTSQGSLSYQPMLPSSPYGSPTPQVNAPIAGTPANPNTGAAPGTTLPFNTENATPSAPQTIRTPNGGLALGGTVAGIDEGKLLAEAELQKTLRGQTNDQQTAGRKAMLDELAGVLAKQQAGAMNDMMPGVYEDLNSRGLLRSSALGEKVGLESAKLSRQTAEQLALQGITDRNKSIDALGSIEDSYLGARGTALQRRFSLEDFDRQVAAGEKLGANALPQISQPSGKGAGALQGALGGATIGAQVGGPTGAATGGVIGLIGGGQLGGK